MSADDEVTAMGAVAKALDPVKENAPVLARVLRWASDRYGVELGTFAHGARNTPNGAKDHRPADGRESGATPTFGDVAELFDAARPRNEWEKALVVAYWLMNGEQQTDFAGQEVNTRLKNLGHGVANITDTLTKAMNQKPALVIQTAKTGSAKQARKKYKVTRAGMTYVQKMPSRTDAAED